ncbi:MAG: diguanylate cyclase [Gammaproteobacteria bacterium]|nr:MAG: diguanylate cyclase [Gammaproteobacteria bacterium]
MTESKSEDTQARGKILLADDSKVVRLTATKILSEQFDLVVVEDGEEAWEKICADESIHVIFTDLGMPKLDGYGLIQRIRQSENEGIRNQPIIVITGAADEEDVKRKVFELGATDFISKPFKSAELVARAEAHASYRRDKVNLQKSADIDLLTGTLNRNGINQQLKKDLSFANRHGENMAVIIFELDDFKTLYQRIGEAAANRIIKQTATKMLSAIRSEDSVGRYGFEKFIAILPMAKTEGVVILAKRLCEQIKSFKITIGGEAISISMSAGISTVRKGSPATIKELVHSAEQALVNAKKVGSGEVQILKLETAQLAEAAVTISIDRLLEAIAAGKPEMAKNQIASALHQLAPLIALMSKEQKQHLLSGNEP